MLIISIILKKIALRTSRVLSAFSLTPYKAANIYSKRIKKRLPFVGEFLCSLCLVVFISNAQAETQFLFDIPAQPLVKSLDKLSNQTETLVLFPYNLVEHRQAKAIKGHYTVMGAVAGLLNGTDLVGGFSKKGVLVISKRNANINYDLGVDRMKSKKNLLAATVAFFMGRGAAVVIAADDQNQIE